MNTYDNTPRYDGDNNNDNHNPSLQSAPSLSNPQVENSSSRNLINEKEKFEETNTNHTIGIPAYDKERSNENTPPTPPVPPVNNGASASHPQNNFKKIGAWSAALLFFGGIACGAVFNELAQHDNHRHHHKMAHERFKDEDRRNFREHRRDMMREERQRENNFGPDRISEVPGSNRDRVDGYNGERRNSYIPEQVPSNSLEKMPSDLDHRAVEPNQKAPQSSNPTPPVKNDSIAR